MASSSQDFGIYIRENRDTDERKLLLVEKGMSIGKIKKLASKLMKHKTPIKKLYLSSGKEVKFVDELKQDAEVYISCGEKFYKSEDSYNSLKEFKISVLGSGGVGKSALTLRFVKDKFIEKWDPTIEDAYSKVVHVDGTHSKLSILDTAGQDNFESMRPHWLRDKDGYVFVFAVDSQQSFDDLSKFVKLNEEINIDKKVPIILVGNKIDKKDNRVVKEANAVNLASKVGASYIETSALTGENVKAIFENMIRLCRNCELHMKPIISKCVIL